MADDETRRGSQPIGITPAVVVLVPGETVPLHASRTDVSWTSSNPAVATVSSSGVVTAMAPGAAAIQAKSRRDKGTMSVTVRPVVVVPPDPPVEPPLTVAPPSAALYPGETVQAIASEAGASWVSSQPAVATVTAQGGLVTGIAEGTAAVTARVGSEQASMQIVIRNRNQIVSGPFDDRRFVVLNELFGAQAYLYSEATTNLTNGLATGFTFWEPFDAGMQSYFAAHRVHFMGNLMGATKVKGQSAGTIETTRQAMAAVCASLGTDQVVGWNLMIEWDQAGGAWVPSGRPSYVGQTRAQALSTFTTYYLTSCPPLQTYLQTAKPHAVPLVAQTDFPANVATAYEMGVDVVLLERGIDELSSLSSGLAFVRGASRQYDKRWGIDISTWRTSNDKATEFATDGTLLGGWSPSYIRRHLYLAFMAGAQILNIEPTVYYHPNTSLNPFSTMIQGFLDCARTRHPDVGRPVVPLAFLMNRDHGFDAKHWLYLQADYVWYGDLPYTDADAMVNNVWKVAYPGHELHGLTPGAPFSDASGFQSYLAAGGDPRPYEPMGSTRWGDNIDVLVVPTLTLEALRHYRAILLLGTVTIDAETAARLQTWVQEGGILIANTRQVTSTLQSLFGVTRTSTMLSATSSTWLADSTTYTEPAFTYEVVTPTTATVLARTGATNPLITSNVLGSGQAILTTPDYLQSTAKTAWLSIGTRLMDTIQASLLPARISGAAIQYTVNQRGGSILVLLVNNTGTTWTGSVIATMPGALSAVREYVADSAVSYSAAGNVITAAVSVPAYELKLVAFES